MRWNKQYQEYFAKPLFSTYREYISALLFGKNAMKMPIIHRQRILYSYIQIFWRCFSLCPFLWQLEISQKMENEKKKTGAPIKVHINSSTTIR